MKQGLLGQWGVRGLVDHRKDTGTPPCLLRAGSLLWGARKALVQLCPDSQAGYPWAVPT